MKPVVQEDRTGCGLASVATVAGVSYQQVKSVAGQLGIDVQDPQLWSNTKYVRTLLTHYGLSTSPHQSPFKSWDSLPSLALLAIKWHKINARAFWHWVVFWRGSEGPVVLDPKQSLQKNARTDFGRIKPKWFLTVTIPQSNKIA
jgi:ABC-type bacteriocin/lantibiotic exporter with double-glycine peptidase domain